MKLTEDVRAFKFVQGACSVLGSLALVSWFSYSALIMSWVGHRPVEPDPPYIHPFEVKGKIYISGGDLRLAHLLLFGAGVLLLLVVAGSVLERQWTQGRLLHEERKRQAHHDWVKRQNARYLARERRNRA